MAKSITELLNCKSVAELLKTVDTIGVSEYNFANAEIYTPEAAKGKNPLVVRLVRLWAYTPTINKFYNDTQIKTSTITPQELGLKSSSDVQSFIRSLAQYYRNTNDSEFLLYDSGRLDTLRTKFIAHGIDISINNTTAFLVIDKLKKVPLSAGKRIWPRDPDLAKKAIASQKSLQELLQPVQTFAELNDVRLYINRKELGPDIINKIKELLQSAKTIDDLSDALVSIDALSCKSAINKIIFNDPQFVDDTYSDTKDPEKDFRVERISKTLGVEKVNRIFSCFSSEELISTTHSEGHARRLHALMKINDYSYSNVAGSSDYTGLPEKIAEFKKQIDAISNKCETIRQNLSEESSVPTESAKLSTMIWELAKFDEYSAQDIASAISEHYQKAQASASARSGLFGSFFRTTTTPSQAQEAGTELPSSKKLPLETLIAKFAPKSK